jgi:hypothetical protein
MKRSLNGTFHHVSREHLDRSAFRVLRSARERRVVGGSIGLRAAVLGIPPEARHAQPHRAAAYPGGVDPTRDMDQRLNIEGDPEAVLRALLAIATREPVEAAVPPETGDEAIQRLLDSP